VNSLRTIKLLLKRHASACLFIVTLIPIAASAQDVPAQPKQLSTDACAPEERQKSVPVQPGQTQQAPAAEPRENLSNKLARTDGVLCPPPGVDPDIHEQPPGSGRTPVIPPPGSPGGDPSTRPK